MVWHSVAADYVIQLRTRYLSEFVSLQWVCGREWDFEEHRCDVVCPWLRMFCLGCNKRGFFYSNQSSPNYLEKKIYTQLFFLETLLSCQESPIWSNKSVASTRDCASSTCPRPPCRLKVGATDKHACTHVHAHTHTGWCSSLYGNFIVSHQPEKAAPPNLGALNNSK